MSPVKRSLSCVTEFSPAATAGRLNSILSSFALNKIEIEKFKLFIRNTTRRYLDWNKFYTEQPHAIPKIVKAIKAEYSEFFGSDTDTESSRMCLEAALNYGRSCFNGHRRQKRSNSMPTFQRKMLHNPKPSQHSVSDSTASLTRRKGGKTLQSANTLFHSVSLKARNVKCKNRTQQTKSLISPYSNQVNKLVEGIPESPDVLQHDVGTLSSRPSEPERRFFWPIDSASSDTGTGHPVFTPSRPTKHRLPGSHVQEVNADVAANVKRPSFFPADMTPRKAYLVVPFSSPPAYETSDNETSPVGTLVQRPASERLRKSPSNPSEFMFPRSIYSKSISSQEWRRPSSERDFSCCTPSAPQTETRDDSLYRFLESCPTRNMTGLYNALVHIDLTQKHIRVMGTTWSIEQIQNFLRKVFASSCDADGAVVPDIDIIFLAHHFVNYFSEGGTRN